MTQNTHSPDELLRTRAAARFLDVAPRTLESWRARGGGPLFVKLSARAVRYRRQDLAEFAKARLRSSTADTGEQSAA